MSTLTAPTPSQSAPIELRAGDLVYYGPTKAPMTVTANGKFRYGNHTTMAVGLHIQPSDPLKIGRVTALASDIVLQDRPRKHTKKPSRKR